MTEDATLRNTAMMEAMRMRIAWKCWSLGPVKAGTGLIDTIMQQTSTSSREVTTGWWKMARCSRRGKLKIPKV